MHQGSVVGCGHGDGNAQAAGEVRGVVDRTAGLGINSGASVLLQKLNELLEAERIGEFVESRYAKFDTERKGSRR